MPVFHTKTIQMILEPVAEQVSTLVMIHEQGKDGNQMPDLNIPILTVKAAVSNLVKVGRLQIEDTKDGILKQDTPPALDKVEKAADQLVCAADLLSKDQRSNSNEMTPEGEEGRMQLIAGSRGILQGTSDLLLVFDEAEVRRICKVCRNVRDFLQQSSIVAGMEDLVVFVKSLTPGTTTLAKMINDRCKDLTNQNHVAALTEEMDQIKALIPGLISSMKAFVQTVSQTQTVGKTSRAEQAAIANREYYTKQITEHISEIIRLLQLVSTDDVNADPTNVLQLRQMQQKMAHRLVAAKDWLKDPNAPAGGPGELSLRELLDDAKEIGVQAGGPLGDHIIAVAEHIGTLTDDLADLRDSGKGNSPEARRIAQQIDSELGNLFKDVGEAIDNMEFLQNAHSSMVKTLPAAREWLANLKAKPEDGAQYVREVTEAGRLIANSLTGDGNKKDREEILQLCDEIDKMMDQLEKDRAEGRENPELSKAVAKKIGLLNAKVARALAGKHAAATLDSQMNDVNQWLEHPSVNDGGRGIESAKAMISQAKKIAARIQDPIARSALLKKAAECDKLQKELALLIRSGRGDSKEAKLIAKKLQEELAETKKMMKDALIRSVADEFADTSTALKQLTSAATAPLTAPNREENFDAKALAFQNQSTRLAELATQAIAASDLVSQDRVDEVNKKAVRIERLTPQVVNAALIVLHHPENKTAQEHFKTIKDDWTRNMDDLTDMVDDSVDFATFLDATHAGMKKEHEACVIAVRADKPGDALPLAGNISRRARRILMTGNKEVQNTDNPDNPEYVTELRKNLYNIQNILEPTVRTARTYAGTPRDRTAQKNFIDNEEKLIAAVCSVQKTVRAEIVKKETQKKLMDKPPPVPPMPEMELPPPVPPPPEEEFPEVEPNQPIMVAAKELHEEAKKWESTGNNIISAAKKMALLMAKMSRLVGGEAGSRSELIQCAKDIAKASNDVTKFAKEVATQCTDRRIKTDMMKTLDKIPTISTQLRILSTVKATTLGDPSQEKEEEAEQATEMLVHNAQNLMQSVKETVRYAEAASIRIRTDAGLTMRWVRK